MESEDSRQYLRQEAFSLPLRPRLELSYDLQTAKNREKREKRIV